MATAPARMMMSEQTLARMGRVMKVSTALTGCGLSREGFDGGLESGARGGRRRARRDWRTVHQPLHAGGDDSIASLDAVEHAIRVAGNRPHFDRALPGDELAVRLL